MRGVGDDDDDGVAHHLVPAVPRREWARNERRKGKGGREGGRRQGCQKWIQTARQCSCSSEATAGGFGRPSLSAQILSHSDGRITMSRAASGNSLHGLLLPPPPPPLGERRLEGNAHMSIRWAGREERERERKERRSIEILGSNYGAVKLWPRGLPTSDKPRRGTETSPDARLSRGNNYESIYPSHHP